MIGRDGTASLARGGGWIGAIALSLIMISGSAKADLIGGVDFGAAGPSNWGILALGGAGAAGFGTTGTQVSMNGPVAGVFGTATQSNVGIADGGQANFSGTTTINGTLFLSTTNQAPSISQTTIGGGIVQNAASNALLGTAATAAAAGLNTANGLACTGTLCSITQLSSTQTIIPVNPGGQNVLKVSSINLGNDQTVTLGGPAGTNWVIEDSGDLTLNSGTIALASGLTPLNDLIVVNGKASSSGGLNNESVINGVVVVPTGTAQFAPGLINGELIGGGNQVSFVSGASVNVPTVTQSVPEPSSVAILATALAVLALRRRQRAQRP